MTIQPFHLIDLLEGAASKTGNGVIAYPLQRLTQPRQLTYKELKTLAVANAQLLRNRMGPQRDRIILIHFEDHLDNILWLWSVVYAGYTPAMSTRFPGKPDHRQKLVWHLKTLLNDPVCITHSSLLSQLPELSGLALLTVDHIESWPSVPELVSNPSRDSPSQDTALLMLTSGSTGNAKAVCLTHQQIHASVAGKATALPVALADKRSFLNWIRLDHVGSLVEIHFHALFVGVSQVHVQPDDVISNPTLFLDLIDRHRVARTFAPNFFLCELLRVMTDPVASATLRPFDLRCLSYIVSGGEANLVSTCVRVSELLGMYGAPPNVIVPGFGMTETCAGCIYNLSCPAVDVAEQQELTAVGQCVPGIQMRVTGEEGSLEISGPIVFQRYFNGSQDTQQSFTADGWFRTGDTATIDAAGCLRLSGRTKDVMSINGVKVLTVELQAAIEEDMIDGIKPGYLALFSRRPRDAVTEQICVIYSPAYGPEDLEARYRTQAAITRTVLVFTGARPYVLPLPDRHFGRSTLGKLSESTIRRALDQGDYHAEEMANIKQVQIYQDRIWSAPADGIQTAILEELEDELRVPPRTIGVDTTMFETGLTSVGLIKLKRRIEQRLGLDDIPLTTMMKNPTVRSLGVALGAPAAPHEYDPVVTINPTGPKTPLWLLHPGVGEILVFVGLAKFLTDRPVYAMRARGFGEGEAQFADIAETVATYHTAIKATQPQGPYALAGYSYGSMLAFELGKTLERAGDEVRFVGAFNLPPHIKFRMRQLNWHECLLHLAFFLDLVPDISPAIRADIASLPERDAVEYVARVADAGRLAELSLSVEKLRHWAGLAYGLQSMAQDYDPSGAIAQIDVFYCDPLAVVASSKQQWLEHHLSKWSDFVRGDVRYHEVDGEHYTMLAPAHIRKFQAILRKALAARGL